MTRPVAVLFVQHALPVLRILTLIGERRILRARRSADYQLFLAINDMTTPRPKSAGSPRAGICERFHKTILQEFYQVVIPKASILRQAHLSNCRTCSDAPGSGEYGRDQLDPQQNRAVSEGPATWVPCRPCAKPAAGVCQ